MKRSVPIPLSVAAAGPAAVAIFNQSIAAGSDSRFAEMCALRCPPGTRYTDRAADQGIHEGMGKVAPINQKLMLQLAKRAGINTSGKVHKSSLGPVTDPLSWVSCADDIRRAAKIKGLDVDGVIKCNFASKLAGAPPKRTRLARDIVDRFERKYRSADPSLDAKCRLNKSARKELRDTIRRKHGNKAK